jgi:hypothetical protein
METPQVQGPLGERQVDAPIMCQLTRFGLSSSRHLPPTIRDYRRLVRDMADPDGIDPAAIGLLRSAFLVERPTTCYSLSIWSGKPMFSASVPQHISTASRVFGRLAGDAEHGPELFTTTWRLVSVTNNLNWPGLDLRAAIAEAE